MPLNKETKPNQPIIRSLSGLTFQLKGINITLWSIVLFLEFNHHTHTA